MDFVLVQRITEYIYGDDVSASIKLYCGMMYISVEHFTMYNRYKDIRELLAYNTNTLSLKAIELLNKYETMDPETVTYRVHRRAVKRANGVETTPLLAKDLKLVD